VILFENVTKMYDQNVPGMQDVSFHIEKGEFVFLVGPSGSGKSTLIKLVLKQLEPTQGRILVAGGGYPEEHASALSANSPFRSALADRIAGGLPVWAECGGLMYLASALVTKGRLHPMVGALPIVVEQTDRPQGHGYVDACVDARNPFFPIGTRLRGHEFHYSLLTNGSNTVTTTLSLRRGVGIGGSRGDLRDADE